jgi:hypothetical protein
MKKILLSCLFLATIHLCAQTETDGLMMPKKNLCVGTIYQNSSWNEYWEGTFKRENLNLGNVSTNAYNFNANYGFTNKLNLIVGIPYIQTKATAGTLKGQKGFQDFSLTLKYKAIEKQNGKSIYSLIGFAGFSLPMTDYPADYLPLNIGLQSKTDTFRLMGDFQNGKFFTTLSAAYIRRNNIKIDRDSYFTTESHYTNEVFMPDVFTNNFRIGYRSNRLIAQATLENWYTLNGGFDITKNNMPFPSNTMNTSKIGLDAKYTFKKISGLALVGGYNYVIDGRNVGQSKTYYGGVFYNFNFNTKK